MHVYKSKDGKGERRKFNGEVLGGVGCEMVQIRGEDSTGFCPRKGKFSSQYLICCCVLHL